MADKIRGTIQMVPKPREFKKGDKITLYYSIKVNDVYYSVGSKRPPEAGTLVEFMAEQNAKGYWDALKDSLTVIQSQTPTNNVSTAAVAAAANSTMSKDDYWKRKEDRDLEKDLTIQLQSCRNSAIEFVKLLCTPLPMEDKDGNIKTLPALKLPAAVNKREQVLFEAVKKYTQEFVQENSSEKNNKNEQLPDAETPSPSKDAESVSTDDAAWDV